MLSANLIYANMEKLVKTEFFRLLSESSQVTKQEMKTAYENFITAIQTLNQSETDCQTVFRILSSTHIEFRILQSENLCEQGKKCA